MTETYLSCLRNLDRIFQKNKQINEHDIPNDHHTFPAVIAPSTNRLHSQVCQYLIEPHKSTERSDLV